MRLNEKTPIYNSRIIKVFVRYVVKKYPDVNISEVLTYAGMTPYAVEDQAHWFSQAQTDRFYQKLAEKTGNRAIAREAGRYAVISGALAAAQQYALSFIGPFHMYQMMGKLYGIMSRGATVSTRRLGSNKIEIQSVPVVGAQEKPYQCENRLGFFESLARLFTENMATVEHTKCIHQGDTHCLYSVTWERIASFTWRRIRDYVALLTLSASLVLYFTLPLLIAGLFTLCSVVTVCALWVVTLQLEKQELSKTIENQGNLAKDLLNQIEIRHRSAVLVQEIGRALSHIPVVDNLTRTVVNIMVDNLEFDRGLILLCDESGQQLSYQYGYGYTAGEEGVLKQMKIDLHRPNLANPFVAAFVDQKAVSIDNISTVKKGFPMASQRLVERLAIRSLTCVPIVFEKKSLGVLVVDNIASEGGFNESDMYLLAGIASQTAIGITNTNYFRRVQQSEQKYRQLVESANSIILRITVDGKITFFNEFAQSFFGYREAEIIGEDVAALIFHNCVSSSDSFDELVASMVRHPAITVASENKHALPSGQRACVAWTYKPILDKRGAFGEILCIGNDITKLRRAEQQKLDLERRLQRAQKMEAIGTLAGGVAHDLNNILAGLVSYPELLLLEIPNDSSLRESILTIQNSGQRAAAIVQDLLTLARRAMPEMAVLCLNDVVSDFFESLEWKKMVADHPRTRLKLKLEPSLLNIWGSSLHVSKMVMNLVSNAAESMTVGGELTITTANRYLDRAIKGYDTVEEGDYVTLTVCDTGVGIAPKDRDRIFEPFYTKKVMARGGTGLGMAVVWGTVKDHKGYIDLDSKEGSGTTFTLYFPVTRKRPSLAPPDFAIADYLGHGESILVIDDVKQQREIAGKMLSKLGYNVFVAASGEEASAFVKQRPVDLLVLDMIMDPGIDGLETYRRILAQRPHQKAIIASGFSETDRIKEAQRLGAGRYLSKPFTFEKLAGVVKKELKR